ncbi:MAG: hypothetical protein R3B06_13745 [Kofleriaceae bacterium]
MRAAWLFGSIATVAGCGADDVVCPSAVGFTLTAPAGFVEVIDGAPVTVAWRATGDAGATVRLTATATDLPLTAPLPVANLGDGMVTWDGRDATGARVPPANYQLGGEVAAVGGCAGTTIAPDALHLIVVRGVRLPTGALTFTGGTPAPLITVTTVTRASVALALTLDPDPTVAGDELTIVEATVPGEFTPVARMYPFTGTTVDGAAIPAGDYTLGATFGAAAVVGPVVHWTP